MELVPLIMWMLSPTTFAARYILWEQQGSLGVQA